MSRNRIAIGLLACGLLGACTTSNKPNVGTGAVNLVLDLPPTGSLRPVGMVTVGVGVDDVGGESTVSTTPIETSGSAMSFSAADVPVGVPITLEVALRDTSNRLVGYGSSGSAITPTATGDETVTIPVRKPFVYVASDQPPLTLDPTIDASSSSAFQGALGGGSAAVIVSVDGTEIAVLGGTTMTRVGTIDHMPIGTAISTGTGTINDAAVVPGQRRVVVATTAGLTVIDIDANTVTPIALSTSVDRVAVAVTTAGPAIAYALENRVGPAVGSGGTCTGTSSVIAIAIDNGGTQTPLGSSTSLADIAASPIGVWGADPCGGQVVRLDKAATLMTLSGASTVAIQGTKLWATGTVAPVTSADPEGASVELASIDLGSGNGSGSAMMVQLAPKAELLTYSGDPDHNLSIDLEAQTEIALDMAVLPSGEYIAILARMDATRGEEDDATTGQVAIPEMAATVYDILLVDPQTGAFAQRVRASCDLDVTQPRNPDDEAEFQDWVCGTPPSNEQPINSSSTPVAIAALYGVR